LVAIHMVALGIT